MLKKQIYQAIMGKKLGYMLVDEIHNLYVAWFKSELNKLTVVDDKGAKGEILKYHCSPETTEQDIVITDIEFDLMSLQLQHTKKQLLDVMELSSLIAGGIRED